MIKSFHILGVVLFLGNIIVSGIWRISAERSKDFAVIKHSLKLINFTDLLFTLPGIILIIGSGHPLAAKIGGIGAYPWIYHSYALLTVSIILWLGGLLPIQRKQYKIMKQDIADSHLSPSFKKLTMWWSILGIFATLLPLIAMVLMVVQPK